MARASGVKRKKNSWVNQDEGMVKWDRDTPSVPKNKMFKVFHMLTE